MRFSWRWLNELINLSHITLETLKTTLTLAGFEVEDIEYRTEIEDIILNIDITSNRADVCSMVGLAREIGTLFNIPLNESVYKTDILNNTLYFSNYLELQSKSRTLLDFKFSHIKIVTQSSSPIWLKNYLSACGIESTNILSDIYEYINIKWGQDIEILDLGEENIHHKDLYLIDQSQFNHENTNHAIIHKLLELKNDSDLPYLEMILYKNSILSIFGTVSNPDFSCNHNSKSIAIMGQVCSRKYIEQIVLGINTKTTKINKHLKGITRNDFYYAYNETLNLVLSLNKNELGSCNYSYQKHDYNNQTIDIDKKLINNILGPHGNSNDYEVLNCNINQIFKQLNFDATYTKGIFSVKIPEYRIHDITRNIDIVEELARVYGFDKFIDHLPNHKKVGYISTYNKLIKKIRYVLRNFGLHEIVNHSLDRDSTEQKNKIAIYNPVLEGQNQLKYCLITELINTSIYNRKQNNLPLECFEIGKIFYPLQIKNSPISFLEETHLAGILGNPSFSRQLWSAKNQELTWFQAKGLLEEFFEKIQVRVDWISLQNYSNHRTEYYDKYNYHPYRTAILCNKNTGEYIGIFGQLNSKIKHLINNSYNQYIFEINIKTLINSNNKNKHLEYSASNYSIYPSVTRDISLLIPINETVESVKNDILNKTNTLIESVEVFNEYEKTYKEQQRRYVGFRITYRSKHRTLNSTDIKKIDNEIDQLLTIQL